MRPILTCAALLALALPTQDLQAQSFRQAIDLSGYGDPYSSARPFGISYEPSQDLLYVALCGDFATANNTVLVIDPATDTVVDSIPVGLFPEDIAFHYDAYGSLLYGACTNSTSGSVTIWDHTRTPIATVALPDPFGLGTCYPYGILEHQDYFLVSTADGSGEVHAIDLATLSYDPYRSFNTLFRSNGRMAAAGDEIWVPTAKYTPAWDGSEGGMFRHDTGGARPDDNWYAHRMDNFAGYPGGQDVVLLSDGRGYLSGLDFGGRIFQVDADGQLQKAIDLQGVDGYGLAVDPAEQMLAVCGFVRNEVVLVDLLNDRLHARLQLSGQGYSMPNEAVFAHDKLYVTVQGNESVLVYDNLPTMTSDHSHAGDLQLSDSTPDLGTSFAVDLVGFAGQPVALFLGGTPVPGSFQGLALEIGPMPQLHSTGIGNLHLVHSLPSAPSLAGITVYLQGYVTDGVSDFTTEPRMLVLQ